MSAPTPDEIRAAVHAEFTGIDWTEEYWQSMMDAHQSLWHLDEFRKSETAAFDAIVEVGAQRVQEAVAELAREEAMRTLREIAAMMPNLPSRVLVPA